MQVHLPLGTSLPVYLSSAKFKWHRRQDQTREEKVNIRPLFFSFFFLHRKTEKYDALAEVYSSRRQREEHKIQPTPQLQGEGTFLLWCGVSTLNPPTRLPYIWRFSDSHSYLCYRLTPYIISFSNLHSFCHRDSYP